MNRAIDSIRRLLADERAWAGIYVIVALISTTVCVTKSCNNFLIFRASVDHLMQGVDMYALHPAEHADLYKYSPTFALLFAPFRLIPYAPALLLWNLANVIGLFAALRAALPRGERMAAIQLVGLGLITTIDGTQCNGLLAALIIAAFAALERDRIRLAAMAIATGTLVKLFPAAAMAFVIPRKDRIRCGVAIGLALVALAMLPLVVTPVATLVAQYRSWYAMGSVDALDRGASVMRLMHELLGYDGPNWPVQLAGTLILMLPLVRGRWADPQHRRLFLASLLVYAVVFNHKAEQPSYIIALAGVAVWYSVGPRTLARDVLTGAVFAATVPIFVVVAAPWLGGLKLSLEIATTACVAAWLGIQLELHDLVTESTEELATTAIQPAE